MSLKYNQALKLVDSPLDGWDTLSSSEWLPVEYGICREYPLVI